MQTYNIPNIILEGTVMNQSLQSLVLQLWHMYVFNIQIAFNGTPNGTFSLEISDDPVNSGNLQPIGFVPTNFTLYPNSTFTVNAAGNIDWNVSQVGYNWVRVLYTDLSGGSSTATITSAVFNGKGF